MSDSERELGLEARRRLLAQVRHLPPTPAFTTMYERSFTNADGSDVLIYTHAQDEAAGDITVDIRTREFDRSAPFDQSRVYSYHDNFVLDASGEIFATHARHVDSFPEGYAFMVDGVVRGESTHVARIEDVDFHVHKPVLLSQLHRPSPHVPGSVSPAIVEPSLSTLRMLHRLPLDEARMWALVAPGLSVSNVPERQSSFEWADDLLRRTIPSSKPFGVLWTPRASEVSGWDRSFNNFIDAHPGMRERIETAQRRVADLIEMERTVEDAPAIDVPYSLRVHLRHIDFGEAAAKVQLTPTNYRHPPLSDQSVPKARELVHLQERVAKLFQINPHKIDVLGVIQPMQREAGPSRVLMKLDDLVLSFQLRGHHTVSLVVAADLGGQPVWRTVEPAVRNAKEVGAVLAGITEAAQNNRHASNASIRWSSVELDPEKVVAAFQADQQVRFHTVESITQAQRPDFGPRF